MGHNERFKFMDLFEKKAVKIVKENNKVVGVGSNSNKNRLQSGNRIVYEFENGFKIGVYRLVLMLGYNGGESFWIDVYPDTDNVANVNDSYHSYSEQEVLNMGKDVINLTKADCVAGLL